MLQKEFFRDLLRSAGSKITAMRLLAFVLLVFSPWANGFPSAAADRAGCSTASSVQGGLAAAEAREAPRPTRTRASRRRSSPTSGFEAKLYGTGSAPVRAAEHEGRIDLWTGLATSPVALTLRDKRNYLDLTGLARLRWIVRTNAIHTLSVVKFADGTLAVGSRGISTDDEFVQVEIAFSGMKWYTLIPQKIVVMLEVKNPDLSKVDEVGLASLAPGGGHGIAGSANFSTVELFAKGVPR